MQRVVVLGAGGTVGRAFCRYARSFAEIHRWDRKTWPLDDFDLVRYGLEVTRPDLVYNFAVASDGSTQDTATINAQLPLQLAKLSRDLSFKLIQTSSVMVFSSDQQGPFDHEREPQAVEGYGFEKRSMEAVIATSGTNSVVVRLGWQIGSQAGSNNMVDFLERQFASDGVIRASPSWYPSCSHLDETAEFLWAAKDISPGIYQFSTNRGQSFYDIVQGLKYKLDRADWRLVADTELSGNQLMIDRRIDRFCHELDTSSSLRNVMDA